MLRRGASCISSLKYTIKYLNEDSLQDLVKLQKIMLLNLPDPELYQPASIDILKERLCKEHSVIGAVTDEGLIAFGIIHIPGDNEDNLGIDIGMSKADQDRVAHIQYIIVHPDYRGNSLQEKLAKYLLEVIKETGYTHVLGTISPKNYYSLCNMLKLGFVIMEIKPKYGDWLRCIIYRDIDFAASPTWQDVEKIKSSDIERQETLLKEGFVGFDVSGGPDDFLIHYGRAKTS